METGEWGKPVKVDVSQKSRDWMTKLLAHQARRVLVVLRGLGESYKVLSKV